MKARDVKCPKCGAGLKDVHPDYEIGIEDRLTGLSPPKSKETYAHCANGHRLVLKHTGHVVVLEPGKDRDEVDPPERPDPMPSVQWRREPAVLVGLQAAGFRSISLRNSGQEVAYVAADGLVVLDPVAAGKVLLDEFRKRDEEITKWRTFVGLNKYSAYEGICIGCGVERGKPCKAECPLVGIQEIQW